jgi:hypothetical protein
MLQLAEVNMTTYTNQPEDERTRVLRMVEEGKLSAMEAISLLEGLGRERSAGFQQETYAQEPLYADQPTPDAEPQTVEANGAPRWFRILVTDMNSGRSKVRVNIPFRLASWGMRVGAHFNPEINGVKLEELNALLQEEGIRGKLIDVVDEEDGEHVEIFIE